MSHLHYATVQGQMSSAARQGTRFLHATQGSPLCTDAEAGRLFRRFRVWRSCSTGPGAGRGHASSWRTWRFLGRAVRRFPLRRRVVAGSGTSRGLPTRGRLGLDAGASGSSPPRGAQGQEGEGDGAQGRERKPAQAGRLRLLSLVPTLCPLSSFLRSGHSSRPYALRGDGSLGRSAASCSGKGTSRGLPTRGRLGLDAGASGSSPPRGAQGQEGEGDGAQGRERKPAQAGRLRLLSLVPTLCPLSSFLRSGHSSRPYALRGDGSLGRSAASCSGKGTSRGLPTRGRLRFCAEWLAGVACPCCINPVRGEVIQHGQMGENGRFSRLRPCSLICGMSQHVRRRALRG